jgi:hypothetical protein
MSLNLFCHGDVRVVGASVSTTTNTVGAHLYVTMSHHLGKAGFLKAREAAHKLAIKRGYRTQGFEAGFPTQYGDKYHTTFVYPPAAKRRPSFNPDRKVT